MDTAEKVRPDPALSAEDRDPRLGGLMAFHRRRKQDSRDRLLAAAIERFCERGYFAVTIDDIASAAGVSRVTFYRHFTSKAALTAEVFRNAAETRRPLYRAIRDQPFQDRPAVLQWITDIFEADKADHRMLRIFIQATTEEGNFTQRAQALISDLIMDLGMTIPAFGLDANDQKGRRRWQEAWLLLYEILDQSNHAALGTAFAPSSDVIDILADRFLQFVGTDPTPKRG
ncbi:TetR/AcrR family transcriptional regulator [Brevundimonas sp. NIBR10]|uniref:TetR/AcrR family transcriptional regulator n=1 Tax=Brevundimonas sp. NIBR10 TaxID=3015997 RepID=UPI0022F1981A|nr:TetR/AcrR family transcriptional regulator [Brevundimonas sp. NIBR10]